VNGKDSTTDRFVNKICLPENVDRMKAQENNILGLKCQQNLTGKKTFHTQGKVMNGYHVWCLYFKRQ